MPRELPVPAGLDARAKEWLAGHGRPPARPRPAATVILLRGEPEFSVYLLRRRSTMAFAAGMHAFPGGGVDARDADAVPGWSASQDEGWSRALDADPRTARSLVCAAVRETFEESGVLLAGPDETRVVADVTSPSWEDDRQALQDRRTALSELLRARGLVLRTDLLRAWAHWVTPELEERRYDTRFFVAALPEGQRTRDVGGEADRVLWAPPARLVAEHHSGRLAMLPPTLVALEELADLGSVEAVMGTSRAIVRVMPEPDWAGEPGGGVVLRFGP